jgi:hypothetical protein
VRHRCWRSAASPSSGVGLTGGLRPSQPGAPSSKAGGGPRDAPATELSLHPWHPWKAKHKLLLLYLSRASLHLQHHLHHHRLTNPALRYSICLPSATDDEQRRPSLRTRKGLGLFRLSRVTLLPFLPPLRSQLPPSPRVPSVRTPGLARPRTVLSCTRYKTSPARPAMAGRR